MTNSKVTGIIRVREDGTFSPVQKPKKPKEPVFPQTKCKKKPQAAVATPPSNVLEAKKSTRLPKSFKIALGATIGAFGIYYAFRELAKLDSSRPPLPDEVVPAVESSITDSTELAKVKNTQKIFEEGVGADYVPDTETLDDAGDPIIRFCKNVYNTVKGWFTSTSNDNKSDNISVGNLSDANKEYMDSVNNVHAENKLEYLGTSSLGLSNWLDSRSRNQKPELNNDIGYIKGLEFNYDNSIAATRNYVDEMSREYCNSLKSDKKVSKTNEKNKTTKEVLADNTKSVKENNKKTENKSNAKEKKEAVAAAKTVEKPEAKKTVQPTQTVKQTKTTQNTESNIEFDIVKKGDCPWTMAKRYLRNNPAMYEKIKAELTKKLGYEPSEGMIISKITNEIEIRRKTKIKKENRDLVIQGDTIDFSRVIRKIA